MAWMQPELTTATTTRLHPSIHPSMIDPSQCTGCRQTMEQGVAGLLPWQHHATWGWKQRWAWPCHHREPLHLYWTCNFQDAKWETTASLAAAPKAPPFCVHSPAYAHGYNVRGLPRHSSIIIQQEESCLEILSRILVNKGIINIRYRMLVLPVDATPYYTAIFISIFWWGS